MKKKLTIVVVLLILFSACRKNTQTACGTQVCTDLFASVTVIYKDSNNNTVPVTNFKVVNLRTGKTLTNILSASADLVPGGQIIVDDSDLKDLSTDGDNVQVTATVRSSGKMQTTLFKIAGGCNCHVTKLSGPDVITVN